jgi:hypothetical protein
VDLPFFADDSMQQTGPGELVGSVASERTLNHASAPLCGLQNFHLAVYPTRKKKREASRKEFGQSCQKFLMERDSFRPGKGEGKSKRGRGGAVGGRGRGGRGGRGSTRGGAASRNSRRDAPVAKMETEASVSILSISLAPDSPECLQRELERIFCFYQPRRYLFLS